MAGIFEVLKWAVGRGSDSQNFLGARWVTAVLKIAPASLRRRLALKILALSPHYFLNADDPKYAGYSSAEYLEDAFQCCRSSREKLYDQVLAPYILPTDTVLDYGCGPGFLSRVLARNAARVYAADISSGALESARILNNSGNIDYLLVTDAGLTAITDGTIDAVVSIAMVQHISDEILNRVLKNCNQKLRPGGRLIVHVPLLDELWRTENEWRADTTLKGKLKLKYGLHCFGRSAESIISMFENHGFRDVELRPIADIADEDFDDVCSQHLLTARKPAL